MNGQNKNRKSIDDIINASDLAELLSDSLQIRRPKSYISREDRPRDYIDYIIEQQNMGNPTEDIDREGLVRYYLSKLNLGESPYTSDIIEAGGRDKEVGKRYRRRMSMFGDRRKEEDWRYNSKYGWGHPKNIEFKDAHAVKRHLEKGKSFEDLDDSIKRRVLSEAQIFTHNENRGQDRFYRRYHKDTEVNPFNPEYRMQEAPMPNVETERAQAPSLADLLKVSLSKMFRR